MKTSTVRSAARTRARWELLSVLTVWFTVAATFASAQELWLDETTQLGGLGLGPFRVVGWLATHTTHAPDVPVDRMPPLSYWLGWLWACAFGASQASMRALGIVLVGVAAAFVFAAARRAFGPRAGLISGVAFALSPNVIVTAAEIRAYPLLLALAAIAFYLLVRLHDEAEIRRSAPWAALTLTCIAACYTHFFGLVLAGAVFVAALSLRVVRRGALGAWAISAATIAIASAGLVPFVATAVARSSGGGESAGLAGSFVRLLYRTLGGHPAVSVYEVVLGAVVLAVLLGLGCAVFLRPNARVGLGLLAALGSGFVVVGVAKAATRGFDALSPSYNLWMLPPVFIALGALARLGEGRSRALALAPVGLLWLSSAGATFVLLEHRSAFAHTATARVERRILAAGASEVAVIHAPTGSWGHGYFPLSYELGSGLSQYLAAFHDGELELRELPHLRRAVRPEELRFERVLVVSAEPQGAGDLKAFIRDARAPRVGDGRVEKELEASGFVAERSDTYMALFATKVVSMQRAH